MKSNDNIIYRTANAEDKKYAKIITDEMEASARARGTGIAKRSPEYVEQKMEEGKAVIAVTKSGTWVGFCYIEAWGHGKYVANSGLIVSPDFRGHGAAKKIKHKVFELSREKYPESKIFGLTTGLAVMKINSELGYEPVTYSELTDDEQFWKGCQSCVNYDILTSKGRKNCICTAMLFDPAEHKKEKAKAVNNKKENKRPKHKKRDLADNLKLFERWVRFKTHVMLSPNKKKETQAAGGSITNKKKFSLFNLF